MRLVTFDLDDTLMRCGKDYGEAKTAFGEYAAARCDATPEEAVETLEEYDQQNVSEHGLSMDRFPESMVQAFDDLVPDASEEERDHVRDLGYSVFKSAEEYGERGFIEGAEELLQALQNESFDLHLITAGDPRVQQPKIDGLGLDRYFDDTHIVPIDSKHECLEELMAEYDYTPEETFLVGNSLTSDVQAALKADANAIYVPLHEWRATEDTAHYRDHEHVTIYETPAALGADSPDVFLQNQRPVASDGGQDVA